MVNAMITQVDGHAEHEAANAMINVVRQTHEEGTTLTLGADKCCDGQKFIEALQQMIVSPHVANNTSGRKSAVPDAVGASEGYAISLEMRKCIEQVFDWARAVGRMRQVLMRGLKNVDQMFVQTMKGYNLTRLRTLYRYDARCLLGEKAWKVVSKRDFEASLNPAISNTKYKSEKDRSGPSAPSEALSISAAC